MTFLADGPLGTVVMTLLTCQDSMVAKAMLSLKEMHIYASALYRSALLPRATISAIPPSRTILVATQKSKCIQLWETWPLCQAVLGRW